jgi:serine phosphatase RsbU (regulator of sigma subunit)
VEFGSGRVCDVVGRNRHLSARGVVDAIFQAVTDFRGARTQDDDMTAVAVKIRG